MLNFVLYYKVFIHIIIFIKLNSCILSDTYKILVYHIYCKCVKDIFEIPILTVLNNA